MSIHPPEEGLRNEKASKASSGYTVPVARWLLLTILILTGCQRGSPAGGGSTTTTLGPPATTLEATTTTTSPTSFEVPAVIDLPYVQRVLETIYHLDGEATRHVYAKKIPDAELNERLEAIFGGARLKEAQRVLGENAAEGFVRFADPPGDATVRAIEIIEATPTCMVIRADLDYGPQLKAPGGRLPRAIVQMARADVLSLNPTGWGVVGAGTPIDPNEDLRTC
jgi:hypothetical protein